MSKDIRKCLRVSCSGLLQRWSDALVHAGRRVYLHRGKGTRSDIERVTPFGHVDAASQKAFAKGLTPEGKSPQGAFVMQAPDILPLTAQKTDFVLPLDWAETCDTAPIPTSL